MDMTEKDYDRQILLAKMRGQREEAELMTVRFNTHYPDDRIHLTVLRQRIADLDKQMRELEAEA